MNPHAERKAMERAAEWLREMAPAAARFAKVTIEIHPGLEFPIIAFITAPGSQKSKEMHRA